MATAPGTFKYDQLKLSLLDKASILPAGSRLPSVVQLMNKFSVSRSTITRALNELKREGLIETRIGAGIFTRSPRPALKLQRLDILLFGESKWLEQHTYHGDILAHLVGRLGVRDGWLRATTLPLRAKTDQILSHIDQLKPEALVLINLNDASVAATLATKPAPSVLLLPSLPANAPHSILVDNRVMVRHWVKHLTELGHRHIAYLHNARDDFYIRDHHQRVRFFYEEMSRAGLLANPDLVRFSGHNLKDAALSSRQLLSDHPQTTAIICADNAAAWVYQAARGLGRSVGDDLSVIGTDDIYWAARMDPPLTTVRIDRGELAEWTISRLDALLRGEAVDPMPQYLLPKLVVRASTGKPHQSAQNHTPGGHP